MIITDKETYEAMQKETRDAINNAQRKKKDKALSSCSLETRNEPDKDTKFREKVSGGEINLNRGNHAENSQEKSSRVEKPIEVEKSTTRTNETTNEVATDNTSPVHSLDTLNSLTATIPHQENSE